MKILSILYKSAIWFVSRNPSGTAGALVFCLAFVLVAGNALYSQPGSHPDPLWQTQDASETESIIKPVKVTKSTKSITRSVLTQSISVRNIPVPTANPARYQRVAAQSSLVRDVQAALSEIKIYDGKVDGIFGSATREAIILYQESAGILPDGEASYGLLTNLKSASAVAKLQRANDTVAKPVVAVKQPQLIVFDTEMVSRIQTGLRNKFGEEQISIDGVMGAQTKAAIRNFQKRFDLEQTGEPDDETIAKLLSVGILNNI